MGTYSARRAGEDVDLTAMLSELSMNAHDLKGYLKERIIYSLDWGTVAEVNDLTATRFKLMNNIIRPIEIIRSAVREVDEDV
jgi:hypothetical protein